MARKRISQRSSKFARGLGGEVYGQPLGLITEPLPLSGFDPHDQKPAHWHAPAHPQNPPLAGWQDGPALGRRSLAHDVTEFSEDHGVTGSVDAQSSLGSEECVSSTGGSVECSERPLTSNESRDAFRKRNKPIPKLCGEL